ncbi:SDR family NAD(P)-dependent oxidoreductase [Streptomyces sp. KL116D]|uniref:SDR family NAD(P)-dependent oxidoreductase n=1 Tax=Streptomyces sp. KL116D TaxID=3045152 RepID=UPI0035573B29
MSAAGEVEFAGKVALVTAAAGKGIGQAVCRRLADGGATVVVTDRHPGRTEEVAAAIAKDYPQAQVIGLPLDVADRAAIDRAVDTAVERFGSIDILVNNAAVNVVAPIFEYDPDTWDWVVQVNLTGPWYLCRRIMPLMRDHGAGTVVNIGSYAPDVGGNGIEAPYAATKGALNVLTRSCAHEGGPHGIRVNCVSMGMVQGTKFIDDHPELKEMPGVLGVLGDLPHAQDIAEAVAYLASDRARFVTGEILNVSAGSYMRN